MIDHLVDCKQAVYNVTLDETYMAFEFELSKRKNEMEIQAKAKRVRLNIHSEDFWIQCNNFLHMVEPVLLCLCHFDGKVLAMPKAFVMMAALKDHIYSLKEAPFFLDSVVAARFEKQFNAR